MVIVFVLFALFINDVTASKYGVKWLGVSNEFDKT
jgi:hypothetical protein